MQMNFNAGQHQARVAGGAAPVLPAGKYPVIMATAEPKETRNKNGDYYIEAGFFVTDGEKRGAKIIARYNVQNQNPTAVEMAMGELACLSLAVGVPQWQDIRQLFNRPLVVDLGIEKREWTDNKGATHNSEQNRIEGYYTMQGVDASTLQSGGGGGAAVPGQTAPQAPPQMAPGFVPAPAPGAAWGPGAAPAPMPGATPAPAPSVAPPPWQQSPASAPQVAPPPWAQQGQPQQQPTQAPPPWGSQAQAAPQQGQPAPWGPQQQGAGAPPPWGGAPAAQTPGSTPPWGGQQ